MPSRWRTRAGAVVVLVLVALGLAVLVSALTSTGSSVEIAPTSAPADAAPTGQVFVHILGAVQRPGLYELREGARAVDAVAAAGGFLDTADQAALNLARVVVDGEQLVVPVLGETAITPGTSADGRVNINTADASTLDTLPRIGPALAERILSWRESNGRFTTIEELMSVPGIGDATFEGLKDLVTV